MIGMTIADAIRREGRAEGEVKAICKAVLRQGRKKWGEPDEAALQAIQAINDEARLNRLLDALGAAKSWADLLNVSLIQWTPENSVGLAGTVRLALAFYVLSLTLRGLAHGRRDTLICSRNCWTAGCLAYLLHVVCAFGFFHHWSHAEAFDSTARQTAEVVGLNSGVGLYVNYAFTLVWTADVCWWWVSPKRYLARPRFIEWTVQGFMGFIAFNATVVFASGFTRWFGVAACLLLLAVLSGDIASRHGRGSVSHFFRCCSGNWVMLRPSLVR